MCFSFQCLCIHHRPQATIQGQEFPSIYKTKNLRFFFCGSLNRKIVDKLKYKLILGLSFFLHGFQSYPIQNRITSRDPFLDLFIVQFFEICHFYFLNYTSTFLSVNKYDKDGYSLCSVSYFNITFVHHPYCQIPL